MLTAPDFRNLFLSSDASTASTQPPVGAFHGFVAFGSSVLFRYPFQDFDFYAEFQLDFAQLDSVDLYVFLNRMTRLRSDDPRVS